MKLNEKVFTIIGCCAVASYTLYKLTKEITNTIIVFNNRKLHSVYPFRGPVGDRGKSAYEIAVDNGFIGSEKEWLKSLKGKSAYEIAVDKGFKGTEVEWLNSLKISVGNNVDCSDLQRSLRLAEMYSNGIF